MENAKRFSFFSGLGGKLLILVLASVLITSCSKKREEEYVAGTVNMLYNEGKKHLDRNNYPLAAAFFNEVERQHPYTEWARRAQLMAAYSNYMDNEYDEAVLSAERFLAVYPGNSSAPYAWYLIAMSYYEQSDTGHRWPAPLTCFTMKAKNTLIEIITPWRLPSLMRLSVSTLIPNGPDAPN